MCCGVFNLVVNDIPQAPADPIFGVSVAFQQDTNPNKINLGVGAYRTEEGRPYVLNCVTKAEQILLEDKVNKEYLPIDGSPQFTKLSANLLFGDEIIKSHSSKIVSCQSISGTGALRIGMEFISKWMKEKTIYFSDPTWPNHQSIANHTHLTPRTYTYYNKESNKIDFEAMCRDLKNAPSGAVIVLHACAHNPTGLDPTEEQWDTIADILQERKLFPFFDCAYQGFASGDLNRDAAAVRKFVNRGMELFVAQSFAKNFGLYGERAGCFHAVLSDPEVAKKFLSQVKVVVRANFSNPPIHGAYIVQTILSRPELRAQWEEELKGMANRIYSMRKQLYEDLKAKNIDWPHIMKQIGMFSYSGLTAQQVEALIKEHHIYMTSDGRISLPGLSTKTVPVLADAIAKVVAKL